MPGPLVHVHAVQCWILLGASTCTAVRAGAQLKVIVGLHADATGAWHAFELIIPHISGCSFSGRDVFIPMCLDQVAAGIPRARVLSEVWQVEACKQAGIDRQAYVH